LASAGICEIIPVTIQAHLISKEVALYGCEAIFWITGNDPVTSGLGSRFGHSGGCEALVRYIYLFHDFEASCQLMVTSLCVSQCFEKAFDCG
jgi:hypothetical protein